MTSYGIVIPAYNEEANIGALLEFLYGEQHHDVVVIDDLSTDATPQIVRNFAARWPGLQYHRNETRSGPLAGWVRGAQLLDTHTSVFIDADCMPKPGAIRKIVTLLGNHLVASGQITPVLQNSRLSPLRAAMRFSSAVQRSVRLRQPVLESVIGRFVATDRAWFIEAVTRTDLLACDAYLACLAHRSGDAPLYVDDAEIVFAAPSTFADARSQRHRADSAYTELRKLGILTPETETPAAVYLKSLASVAMRDPIGAAAWIGMQAAIRVTARGAAGSNGAWETPQSTKMRLKQ